MEALGMFKKIFIILSLLPSFLCADENFPSRMQNFQLKHSLISKVAKLAAIGGIAYGLRQRVNPWLTGLTGLMSLSLYERYKKTSLLHEILCDPRIVYHRNYSLKEAFRRETSIDEDKEINEDVIASWRARVKKYEKKSPLFFLGECAWEDDVPCILSRLYEPKYRETYEDKVVAALVSKAADKQEPTHYVSFASGGRLTDLVILTKTLTKKPDAQLHVHLIDYEYTPFVFYLNAAGHSWHDMAAEVTFTPEIAESMVDQELALRLPTVSDFEKRKYQEHPQEVRKYLKKQLLSSCLEAECMNQQFINFLRATFPQASLTFHIHESTDGYLRYREEQAISYPDIITAADMEDEMSIIKGSIEDYLKLCISAMQNKPESINIWLAKNRQKGCGELHELSLQPKTKSTEIQIEIDDQPGIIYGTTEEIKSNFLKYFRFASLIIQNRFGKEF